MARVVAILAAALFFLAGMVVSVVGTGWLGALLCTIGIVVGVAALLLTPKAAASTASR